ncbi:MAG: 13E12 repeat family protein [Actinomycetia bacterium]|nr:13E12 repeat family protein [Actinomycetes bacterium]
MCSTATSTSLAGRVRAMASELPDVGLTGDAELRPRLVALEEARNIVEGAQAAVTVEMHGRAESEDAARDAAQAPGIRSFASTHEAGMTEFVSDEIAVLLACTPLLATHRLETAIGANAHPSLMRVWRRGAIDARKVAVIGDSLRDVDPAFADTLAEEAARYATSRTATQTRAWLTRQVLAADPGMAEVRRARANEGRHITLRPVGDGMAELCALLPGVQARQAFDTINALAQAAPNGDARTADQRRADALMDLLTGRAEPPQVKVQVVVSADTLAGESDSPGWVPGLGPITAGEARQIVRGAGPMTCSPLIADPDTGMLADRTTGTSVEPQYRPSAELDRAVRARIDVSLPRLSSERARHCLRNRSRPHRTLAAGSHHLGQPGRALSSAPSVEALGRLAGRALLRRHHDLDDADGAPLRHRAVALPRATGHRVGLACCPPPAPSHFSATP